MHLVDDILYDEQGNPYHIQDMDIDWTSGRQLSSFSVNDYGEITELLSYTYDENE